MTGIAETAIVPVGEPETGEETPVSSVMATRVRSVVAGDVRVVRTSADPAGMVIPAGSATENDALAVTAIAGRAATGIHVPVVTAITVRAGVASRVPAERAVSSPVEAETRSRVEMVIRAGSAGAVVVSIPIAVAVNVSTMAPTFGRCAMPSRRRSCRMTASPKSLTWWPVSS
ncbi:MAG TPA: hypothetical protein H9830_14360 [Candidatus Agrococcus pullicola]|uniref:Uncharacterized protein n=1 Tax=Candidatus Agrococcus pullicola TaxID=2838429 RepID=A0A9D2CB39_9MICO|nr:hypothetical protein [Candidatus Agrococcus pullicola]